MSVRNHTVVSEFIFQGFTSFLNQQVTLFVVFLVIYVITLVGNLGIIVLIKIDPQLHTPMYFFLGNLSFVDFCYSTSITPKTLRDILLKKKAISFTGCFVQMYVFIAMATTECILFVLMAYDRYVAICIPLLYTTFMSHRKCIKMSVGAYAAGFLNSMIHTIFTSSLSFCHSNVINHFFCESLPLLKLSCSDTSLNEIIIFLCAGLNMVGTLLIILSSYSYILSTILRIHSTKGRNKAFSTCASHLVAVIIFYGTMIFIYLRPSSRYSHDQDRVASVFYTMVIPMLNPLIYSLRNKVVKEALRRVLRRKISFQVL
ncbi:olfactory receptor 5F1 [Alligator sinensis]|uniref:Olfactory receptor 5F1 n=1 Tax=Alligator sinensis TaxID=38654 RepID=A0A1U7SKS4_ALLSI|nr:olfactory receptor 5F1 [Alligator sinensis]